MSEELKPCPFCGCHDRRVSVRKMMFLSLSRNGKRKNKSKGVRGLLASVKELFTPKTNGISTR